MWFTRHLKRVKFPFVQSFLHGSADGQAPSRQCPPDDWRLRVYTVYSVYSPEHPNLASVNDPPGLTHLNREGERSEKAGEDAFLSKYCLRVKNFQASSELHMVAVNH